MQFNQLLVCTDEIFIPLLQYQKYTKVVSVWYLHLDSQNNYNFIAAWQNIYTSYNKKKLLAHSRNTGASLSWLYYCHNTCSYICSSANGVSALLVCAALHPQMTHRHCSKFSVAPLLTWTSQNSSTVSSSAIFYSHRRVGKLPGSYSSMHCLSRLYYVSAHSPTLYLSLSIIFMADHADTTFSCCEKLKNLFRNIQLTLPYNLFVYLVAITRVCWKATIYMSASELCQYFAKIIYRCSHLRHREDSQHQTGYPQVLSSRGSGICPRHNVSDEARYTLNPIFVNK